MNEHEEDIRVGEGTRTFPVGDNRTTPKIPNRSDLVLDLTGIQELDLANLALLLTAQQNAQKEDRAIWLAGVPLGVWKALYAMGLGRFFKPFPVSAEVVV